MSRIIVKNLPSYLAETQLRDHFAQRGTVTDVRLVHRRDGTSRRFGFVGYKSENEAQAAKAYFHSTYIDSSKITVDLVEDRINASSPRPTKRRRLSDPPEVDLGSKLKTDKTSENRLTEFMQTMQPRNEKGRSWANDSPVVPTISKPDIPVPVDQGNQEAAISDLEWMKRRMTKTLASEIEQRHQDKSLSSDIDAPMPQETILKTGRLFLRNLPFSSTDTEIEAVFKVFGEVSQVHIPLSAEHTAKGLAFVTFREPTCAVAAYEVLDGTSFQGRLLHIIPAIDKLPKETLVDGKSSLRQERAKTKKDGASREFNWATLYMNSDAIISSISDRMKLSKADLLNAESDNAAVKLALAETHIIQETKAYFEKEGVILESFSHGPRHPRSDTIILIKNIPYGTTSNELQAMFGEHGEITRLLIPPAGTMAVVEFLHAVDASKAFRELAYKRLKNSVMYLEKGPSEMFGVQKKEEKIISDASKPIAITEATEDNEDLTPGTVLFIKNLAFSTTAERLTSVFRQLPEFAFARVQTKPDVNKPGQRLSMGYGFVGFKTAQAAKSAMSSIQGFVLDGHSLLVKFSGRGTEEDKVELGLHKMKTSKMIVKNVPFEATKKDIRELFGAHGQLKSVRLPRRIDARSRGFAFLEFVSRKEAENAFSVLRHTHLLGRHLVLDWAADNVGDIAELRDKVSVGYGGGTQLPGKKRKLDIDHAASED